MTPCNIFNRLWRDNSDERELSVPAQSSDRTLCDLTAALPGFLKWEWDDQTEGALALVEIDAGDQVLEVLTTHLEHSWNRKTLRKAPYSIKAAVKDFGGAKADQRVLAKVLAGDLVLIGLWWPWGHGGTVSIRLVPYAIGSEDAAVITCRQQVKRALRIR